MKQTDILEAAVNKLERYTEQKHLIIGFDGFVDEIIHVVDKRRNPEEYDRITDISTFSERIASVAGLSANIELVSIKTKLGGNGPIMANAIIAQGQHVSYIGAIGKHAIHPVFSSFADTCRNVYSLTEPGHTDALEFYDGKLMLGKMNNMVEVNLENLLHKLPEKELKTLLAETDMVAFTNWTMLSNLNGIIEKLGEIIDGLEKKPTVFIDLADPKKRTNNDILEVLSLISKLPCESILSMNLSESTTISELLDIKELELMPRAKQIRQKTGISGIVIHPLNGAAIAHEKGTAWVDGPYTSEPKLTTGAGDNFNAGFCNAWLGGFEPAESLMMGVCTSGFYVRNAKSPQKTELLPFMKEWLEANCGTI
jgi:sugar/nucleoside kinase (ribokinase family)